MKPTRTVLCMKWGTLYSAEYVNVLYQACCDNITGEFRFVCLTDDNQDLLPSIDVFPIPDIGLDTSHYFNGAWPKIAVFDYGLYDLSGRVLFIDLDSVICGSLDEMFELSGQVVAIDLQPWSKKPGGPSTGTGVFAFDVGTMGFVVDQLKAKRDALVKQYHIEQAYLHGVVNAMSYWPEPWVISFKYHLRPPLIADRFLKPKAPPAGTKILAFHGRPRPIDLIHPPAGNWDRFPHYGSGTVSWMQAYWQRYGGRI